MQWSSLLCEKRARENHGGDNNKSPDLRSEFQKDYHRIIGSASFRRLQDKTQVFPLDKSDFVRTRLTHSIEVSSFAKSLGQNIFSDIIQKGLDSEVNDDVKQKACDVLECAGLIHDIGNPPFGHFGEDAIRLWFKENLSKLEFNGKKIDTLLNEQMKKDFENFEGNAHVLRMVGKLHLLVDENGMNLTYALLNTVIKYPVDSLHINKKSGEIKEKKLGYYYSEKSLFEDITDHTGAKACRHPLTYILEAADDIAYKTADIEDAVKKGLLSYDVLLRELRSEKFTAKCNGEDDLSAYNAIVDKLEKKLENAKRNNITSSDMNAVQNWIIYVQGKMIGLATNAFTDNYTAIMNGSYNNELLKEGNGKVIVEALGDIAYRYAFRTPAILKLEIGASAIFKFLMDKFMNAIIDYDTGKDKQLDAVNEKLVAIISENYKYIYEKYSKDKDDVEKLYLRMMLVTDFICGMTDSYAKSLYQEFNGIS